MPNNNAQEDIGQCIRRAIGNWSDVRDDSARSKYGSQWVDVGRASTTGRFLVRPGAVLPVEGQTFASHGCFDFHYEIRWEGLSKSPHVEVGKFMKYMSYYLHPDSTLVQSNLAAVDPSGTLVGPTIRVTHGEPIVTTVGEDQGGAPTPENPLIIIPVVARACQTLS